MNLIDLIAVIVIGLCAFGGYRKGLIRTVYRLASFFIAMFLARQFHGPVARFLRGTPLFDTIQASVSGALNLEGVVGEHTAARYADVINALPLPENLLELLRVNNTPNMYELLQVYTIEEYISGFFANMMINGIAMIVVFIIVLILLSVVGNMLDIVSYLPVINTFNRAGGLIFGLGLGFVLIWLMMLGISMVVASGQMAEINDYLQGSFITRWFADNMMPQLAEVL